MAKTQKYLYPKRLPLIKFFWNAEAIRKNPIPFHKRFFEQYGDTFAVRLGRERYLMLSRDKEVVQYILQKNHKNYYKSKIQTNYLSKYLGNGLLTSNGQFWLRQRRLIQPAFHKQKMIQLLGLMERTVETELEFLDTDRAIDVFPVMNQLAFRVIANSLFGTTVPEIKVLIHLRELVEEVQKFLVKEVRLPHKGWWFRITGEIAKHKALAEESQRILNELVEERSRSLEEHDDLLDMLMATRYEDTGEPMSRQQLLDEISILFVAGHETTANALTFTSYLLARHPDIQQKVREEVQGVLTTDVPLASKIQQMEYTRAVIDESMRLYPPAWITDRENLEDDDLGEFRIRKDTLVGVSFYELHRNTKYWDDPEKFDPQRFMGENRKKTAGVYFPFGAGPRMCIGMGFAYYEMTLALSYILKHYSLTTEIEEIELNPLITLKPVGVEVKFSRLEP